MHFQIRKHALFQMKNSNKIWKKIRKKIGMVDDDIGGSFSGSSAHFQIRKHALVHMKNSNKIWKK